MAIALEYRPGHIGTGRAIYWQSDLTLEYRPEPVESAPAGNQSLAQRINRDLGIEPSDAGRVLLVADTLTLVFGDVDCKLISLDAYTNRRLWLPSQAVLPEVKGHGSLHFLGHPEDGFRQSLGAIPEYEINMSDSWVRIVLRRSGVLLHYLVADNLVVGLGENLIDDIYLLHVAYY